MEDGNCRAFKEIWSNHDGRLKLHGYLLRDNLCQACWFPEIPDLSFWPFLLSEDRGSTGGLTIFDLKPHQHGRLRQWNWDKVTMNC